LGLAGDIDYKNKRNLFKKCYTFLKVVQNMSLRHPEKLLISRANMTVEGQRLIFQEAQ
jgi:ssDNA-specific exonuclease RecJ